MRWLISIFLLAWVSYGRAQVRPDVYSNPDGNTAAHSSIAILPFYCITDPADYQKAPDYRVFQEKQFGFNLQRVLYYKMVSFSDRYTVTIQDINKTNHLLQQAEITDYRFPDIQGVASLLNVDAVIVCVITYDPKQYMEDDALRNLLARQHVPGQRKRKDIFLSLFTADETCIWTYSNNSEIVRSLLYYEVKPHMYLFDAMQYLPYWKGDNVKIQ